MSDAGKKKRKKKRVGKYKPVSYMTRRGRGTRLVKFHAYDLETTRIPVYSLFNESESDETPTPLYITAFSEWPERYRGGALKLDRCGEVVRERWKISKPLKSFVDLRKVLEADFLIPERIGHRYIAWNGNRFDAFFIGLALLDSSRFQIRPYLTRSNVLRGLRVIDSGNGAYWEFLDGLAMTGITSSLDTFLKGFAPGHEKLKLDLVNTEFDSRNPEHVRYAERDSEGLFYALLHADRIVEKLTDGLHLTTTIGNLGIKYFQKMLPVGAFIERPSAPSVLHALQVSLKRGGYCWLKGKYSGPVWKYDLNQAYAAAMRDACLPSGRLYEGCGKVTRKPSIHLITAKAPDGERPPFYWKHSITGKAAYSLEISSAWLTSDEVLQLEAEGWEIVKHRSLYWSDWFDMREMVNRLEKMRLADPAGPSGPQGLMAKSIGNNAYGKTAECISGNELVMSRECPEGFMPWSGWPEDGSVPLIWERARPIDPLNPGEGVERSYHQPQLACFITAYVRMALRRAILLDYAHWIYADTDCVVFSRPQNGLTIDKSRYGAWKQETDGEFYRFIAKKGYFSEDRRTVHIKGMSSRDKDGSPKFTDKELTDWYVDGVSPVQAQAQRRNFVRVVSGAAMFSKRKRHAQRLR